MNTVHSRQTKSKLFGTALAASLMVLFASVDSPAQSGKSAPGTRIIRDTVDTMSTPKEDGVTYEPGVGRDAERKEIVNETVVPSPKPTVKSNKTGTSKSGVHKSGTHKSGSHKTTSKKRTGSAARDTVLGDTTRILGTPGSPTGAESRGMPGEKPIPGTK